MRKIIEIRTWAKNGSDFRVYVTFEGSKEQGVYYKDGNPWNAKGKLENMTVEEKAAALAICAEKLGGRQAWVTVYKNEIEPTKTIKPLYIHDKYGTLIETD